jgi:integrative and conjugative element protein (TIGR02256 family)
MREKQIKYIEFSDSLRQLRVYAPAIKTFRKHEPKINGPESGGILLGYVYENHDEIIKATIPNRLDYRGPFSFIRSKIPAQRKINISWKKSKGCLIYLGEWHTHSESDPKPSGTDMEMIEKAFKETKMEIDFLYLIIVGLKNTYWVGRKNSNGLTEFSKSH